MKTPMSSPFVASLKHQRGYIIKFLLNLYLQLPCRRYPATFAFHATQAPGRRAVRRGHLCAWLGGMQMKSPLHHQLLQVYVLAVAAFALATPVWVCT